MFTFDGMQVRDDLRAALRETWDELSRPGSWWDGGQRHRLASVARAAFAGRSIEAGDLPAGAVEATAVVGGDPSRPDEAWVDRITTAIGDGPYVEAVGIAARVVAVDTFCGLLGVDLPAFPDPQPGAPDHQAPPEKARKRNTWVPMVMLSPPFVLGAVPSAEAAMLAIIQRLYLALNQMPDPDFSRGGLHRTQIELVAGSTSYANECFF